MRFGVDQIDRAPRGGVFAAVAPVVVFDSPIKIGGYACVQRTISAAYNVNVPGGCRCIIHCMDNRYGSQSYCVGKSILSGTPLHLFAYL